MEFQIVCADDDGELVCDPVCKMDQPVCFALPDLGKCPSRPVL